jgi:hypothetical protein
MGCPREAHGAILGPTVVTKPVTNHFQAKPVKGLTQPDGKKVLSESLTVELVVSNPERL